MWSCKSDLSDQKDGIPMQSGEQDHEFRKEEVVLDNT